jgi:hypothetical protein
MESIKILDSPAEFKQQLLHLISCSKNSDLNCLYIGDDVFNEVLGESKGTLRIGIDYYRGNRSLTSKSMGKMYYWKSPSYSAKYLPMRWNETLGTFHIKAFIMDEHVLLTGANLSRDYFTNRQDRYICIKSLKLATYYRNLFTQLHKTCWTIGPQGWIPPKRGHLYLQQVASENRCDKEEVLKRMEKETTFIISTMQMGALGIRQEEEMLAWIFQEVGSQGGKGWLSSAYLNIPSRLYKVIADSRMELDLLTSSPECNGFYGANNVSKYLPDAYSFLEYQLLQKSKFNSITRAKR